MTAYMPIKGLTVPYMIKRFVEPSLSFAIGWNYWIAFGITMGAEATAAALVIEYWGSPVNSAVWIAIVLAVCLLLNMTAVSVFGEAEFWFASIKILTIIGLIILGIILFFGGGPNHDPLYFRYWSHPGTFNTYLVGGETGRFLGVWYATIRAAFSFILSPELLTMTAGECEAPRRNIPKASRRFIYRLLAFYVLGTLVIGVTIRFDDGALLNAINQSASNAAASPYVIAIQNAGIPVLNHIMNAVILTSAWSSGNSFLYAASRMLYGMACSGDAPKIFSRCAKSGVPCYAVLASFCLGFLAFLNVSNAGGQVFNWLTSIVVGNGFISWIAILITYLVRPWFVRSFTILQGD
ncbi:Sphingolipid C9-methyltransferase 1 [Pestalotiopsis sp. IQ-011]